MATKSTEPDPFKLSYVTLSDAQRANVVREQLSIREDEHFRLYSAFSDSPQSNPRLEAVTNEVKRLQDELSALEK